MFPTPQELDNLSKWIEQNPNKDWRFSEPYKIVFEKLRTNNNQQLEQYSCKYVEIIGDNSSCGACKRWFNKKIPIESAKNLLPHTFCRNKTYGYCRCTFIPIGDDR